METKDIVKINPADYGLEETKAKEIEEAFIPMLSKMTELEDEFNQVVGLEINRATCKIAKEVRLKYVKVRTGTAEIHKDMKAFYLAGGRFVDGWKNAQLFASQGKEKKLKAIEEHFERIEAARKEKLREEREAMLEKYETETEHVQLGEMSDDVWNNYFNGIKLAYEQRIEAEAKAEEDRLAEEKANNLHNERIRQLYDYMQWIDDKEQFYGVMEDKEFDAIIQNLKLKKQEHDKEQERIGQENERFQRKIEREEREKNAEKKAKERSADKFKQRLLEDGYKEQGNFFFKATYTVTNEQLLKFTESEFNERIKEVNKIIASEEKVRKEAEENEKITKELQAKKESEAKEEEEKQAKIEAELSASDKDKFLLLIGKLRVSKTTYSFKSKKYQDLQREVNVLIDKIITHVNSKIE